MKEKQLVPIKNVQKANETINYLQNRKKSEIVGLGLVYGEPGLGKSRWAFSTALKMGAILIRLNETMCAKDFIKQLYFSLKYKNALNETVKGTRNDLYELCKSTLTERPDTVILIDEIDYAFKQIKIMNMIRDLADETFCTIVMIGMRQAKQELLKLNAHYFDRCNAFCEFTPLDFEDMKLWINNISEVEMDDELIRDIYTQSNGTMRKALKPLDVYEKMAIKSGLKKLKLSDIRGK